MFHCPDNAVQTDPTTSNLPLIALLVTLNLIVIACDLAEVNQVYHYTIFGLLGAGAAGRFLQLEYTHRNALSPAVRKKAVAYFFSGVALILAGFAVSRSCLHRSFTATLLMTGTL